MNDVLFNPVDDHLVTAGCTDGVSYVWDLRNPDHILHEFAHGAALMELDEMQARETVDTGVRFLSWGQTARHLFTGSSDGVVSSWNPYLAKEDAHVEEIARLKSGVMTGAFSPDFTDLLLGEVNGSISVLSVGSETSEKFDLECADHRTIMGKSVAPGSGIAVANELVETRQIELRPFGDLPIRQAVQGPCYSYTGYIDQSKDADELRKAAAEMQQKFLPPTLPCNLDHRPPLFTEEEQGDDGAWKDRIPEAVRYAPRTGNPAKVLECFRCRNPLSTVKIDATVEEVLCDGCDLAWRVDILGFTAKVCHLDGFWQPDLDVEDTIERHYHSQWQDRPPSPL